MSIYGLNDGVSIPRRDKNFVFATTSMLRVNPASFNGCRGGGVVLWEYSGQSVRLTTHLHSLTKSRMRGKLPPLPAFCLNTTTFLSFPRQNPALGVLIEEGGNVLGRQTGLWITEAKVWGIVPKAAWHWGGDRSVVNDDFGAPDSTPSNVCFPPKWRSAGGDCLVPQLL
jgi:hypothetical protein